MPIPTYIGPYWNQVQQQLGNAPVDMTARPEHMSRSDWMRNYIYNMAIGFSPDPITQIEIARYLGRTTPGRPGILKYANAPIPDLLTPFPQTSLPRYFSLGYFPPGWRSRMQERDKKTMEGVTSNLVNQLAGLVNPENYIPGITTSNPPYQLPEHMLKPTSAEIEKARRDVNPYEPPPASDPEVQRRARELVDTGMRDVMSGLRWLNEYLTTAQKGIKGSRAQQEFAKQHLATLRQEAQREPNRGGLYVDLAEKMLNPVLGRAPTSGLFGSSRALTRPQGEFRRGGSLRNVTLT